MEASLLPFQDGVEQVSDFKMAWGSKLLNSIVSPPMALLWILCQTELQKQNWKCSIEVYDLRLSQRRHAIKELTGFQMLKKKCIRCQSLDSKINHIPQGKKEKKRKTGNFRNQGKTLITQPAIPKIPYINSQS